MCQKTQHAWAHELPSCFLNEIQQVSCRGHELKSKSNCDQKDKHIDSMITIGCLLSKGGQCRIGFKSQPCSRNYIMLL